MGYVSRHLYGALYHLPLLVKDYASSVTLISMIGSVLNHSPVIIWLIMNTIITNVVSHVQFLHYTVVFITLHPNMTVRFHFTTSLFV